MDGTQNHNHQQQKRPTTNDSQKEKKGSNSCIYKYHKNNYSVHNYEIYNNTKFTKLHYNIVKLQTKIYHTNFDITTTQ